MKTRLSMIWILLICILLFYAAKVLAFRNDAQLWTGFNAQQKWGADKKWLTFVYAQLRLINRSHSLHRGLIEGGLGYRLRPDKSVWIGYRGTANDIGNNFYKESGLFQHLIWKLQSQANLNLFSRTRLEEFYRFSENQMYYRLRQRIRFQFARLNFMNTVQPVFYEEVFMQLNKTNFTSHSFVSANRVFLGFNLFTSSKNWWQIGYINQYNMATPQDKNNEMNHILMVVYNIA